MRFQLNFKSGKPVYLQVVDQVKAAVGSGAVRAGEPLPSIRPLAEELRVNRNTDRQGLRRAREPGRHRDDRRARAVSSRANDSPLRKDARIKLLTEEIDEAVMQAHHLQVGKAEFLRLAEERFDAFAKRARARADKA